MEYILAIWMSLQWILLYSLQYYQMMIIPKIFLHADLLYQLAAYIPLLLNSGGYTLKQAWECLYPTTMHHQEVNICQP